MRVIQTGEIRYHLSSVIYQTKEGKIETLTNQFDIRSLLTNLDGEGRFEIKSYENGKLSGKLNGLKYSIPDSHLQIIFDLEDFLFFGKPEVLESTTNFAPSRAKSVYLPNN